MKALIAALALALSFASHAQHGHGAASAGAHQGAGVVKKVDREAGRVTLWDYDVYFAGDRAAELFYDVPNARRRVFGGWMGAGSGVHRFAVGPWRAPGANMNVWARESQIDIMAAAAKVDPLEFRQRNIKDERMRRCLQEAARKFGWTPAAGPSGNSKTFCLAVLSLKS